MGSTSAQVISHWRCVVSPVLGAVALSLASTAALADTETEQGGGPVEEVIVTAQKRSESLQSVPVSVTALSAAQLAQTKLDTPADLVAHVPNMQQQGVIGEGTPLFALRGVSMFDYSPSQNTPVGTYMDEVYKGSFVLLGVEMYDLERIEVLAGPQGTLYGKATTGGAINFIANKPGFEPEAYVKVGYGNYNRREVEGAAQTGLIPDKVAIRVAATYTKVDGFVENVLPGHPDLEGVDQYGARLSLSYNATEDLKFLLRFSISKQDPQNYAIIDGSIAPGGVGGLGYYRTTNGTATGTPLRNDQVAQDFTPRREQDTKGVALTTNWQMAPAFLLTSITSWDEGNLYIPEGTDGAPIDIFKYVEIGKDRQFIEDLRLTSTGDGPLRYIAGAFYQHDVVFSSVANRFFDSVDVNNDGVLNYQDCLASSFGPGVGYSVGSIINAGCNYQNRYDQIRNSWAAYSDVSYQLTEPVKLRLGVRYNHDNAAQKNAQALLLGSDNVPIGNIIPGSVVAGVWQPVEALPGSPNYNAIIGAATTQYAHNSAVTGRVGVDYTPVKNILLYASYSRGYRPAAFAGQFDFSASDLSTVPAETLDAVEAGFKTDLLGRQLQLNGAVFHYQYKHQQLLDVQPNGAQPLISLGKSKIDGGELELVARPVQSFTIRGNLGLLNARIEEGYISGGTLNAAGHTLPNSPRASAMLGADWDFLKLDRTRYHLHVDGNYWSKQYFELVNEDRIAQSPYGLLNARLSLLAVDDKLEIGAWGRNLTDHFYLTNAIDFQSLGYDYRHRGIPRMFGIDAAYHF